jgi:hypothetical protein
MTARRRKLSALAASVLAAVCLLVVLWPRQEADVRPDQFDRIRLGMSRDQVEGVLGLEAGYMAYDGVPYHTLIAQEGPDMEAARMLHWCGQTHSIFVWLDDDGRVACRALVRSEWSGTDPASRAGRRLGWAGDTK